jgi:hypothetical protein
MNSNHSLRKGTSGYQQKIKRKKEWKEGRKEGKEILPNKVAK